MAEDERKNCPKCETLMTLGKAGCCSKVWVCPNKECGQRVPYNVNK